MEATCHCPHPARERRFHIDLLSQTTTGDFVQQRGIVKKKLLHFEYFGLLFSKGLAGFILQNVQFVLGITNGGLQSFQFLGQFAFADRMPGDCQALAAGTKEGGTANDSWGRGCAH